MDKHQNNSQIVQESLSQHYHIHAIRLTHLSLLLLLLKTTLRTEWRFGLNLEVLIIQIRLS